MANWDDLFSGGMIMPKFIVEDARLSIKTAIASSENSTSAGFYTALNLDFTDALFETSTLQPVADTTEQTIHDTGTGVSGVLTQILSPKLSAAGDITIRVTLDGVESVFSASLASSSKVLCVGDFASWKAETSAANGVGYGGGNSEGYDAPTTQNITMLTPRDTAAKGLPHGMIFKDSMKVTVQGSVNLTVGSATHQSSVSWLTYIPEGA